MKDLELESIAWPTSRIAEAIGHLANSIHGRSEQVDDASSAAAIDPQLADATLGPWLESVATNMELEALAVEANYGSIEALLGSCPPALLRLPNSVEPLFLVVLAGNKRRLTVLCVDGGRRTLSIGGVANRLRSSLEHDPSVAVPLERILNRIELGGRQRETTRGALLLELHGDKKIADCWLIRPVAAAPLGTLVRDAKLMPLLASVAVLHLLQYSLWILAWWLLGWMSVRGRFEPGLFWAWMLLLLGTIPFRVMTEAGGGTLAIRAGILLKRRLLAGVFRLEPQEVRHLGIGQLLGRVIESEAVESLAVSGGFLALTAVVELLVTMFVLASGAGGLLHVGLLVLLWALTVVIGVQFFRRQLAWTQRRLDLTNDLVERMIGHRTRLAQQPPERWNQGEDEAVDRYLSESRRVDGQAAALAAFVPRGWLIAGLLGLAPAFVSGSASTVSLAIGLGGVLLAFQALRSFVEGNLRLVSAAIAWRRINFLLSAATRREPLGRPQAERMTAVVGKPLVTARDIGFRYPGRSQPVLQAADLSIHAGERLLLEGTSGGGKSTLASLLSGSRVPDSGLLLLNGLDRETIGAANWRRRVVLSPQFHENHVLMGTLSFNLLMGRRWPPTQDDLEDAERACRELGLGPLLDRMPGGMSQMVGETGWQLSHGEKSRIYLARALLQRADVTILDETFAALDPQNLQLTLTYVLKQTPTVLVIAHP